MEATFMPKPYRDHAGSGAHLHVSVLDAQGRNIFEAEDPGRQRAAAARDRRVGRDDERRDGCLRARRRTRIVASSPKPTCR